MHASDLIPGYIWDYEILHEESDDSHEHFVIRFPNGFAVSFVQNHMSFGHEEGLWEAALCVYEYETGSWCLAEEEKARHLMGWNESVRGWLTPEECREIARLISLLDDFRL